ncbi:MAG TPA: phosphatidylglycerophosphatase A [Kofleriaceae bacterium]|nr:phosphatidylglycerophosphatase A [Kofleriaceae bacterium]
MADGGKPGESPRTLATRASILVATVLGVGYAPIAPGTWGTAVAVPLVWIASDLPQWGYLALCVAVTAVAIAASAGADRAFGEHDSGKIVVDEVAGYFWTMLGASQRGDWLLLLVGFVLFRVADIFKPPPARAIDRRMSGGPGVVLDDVVAGWWAAAALWALDRFDVLGYMRGPW